MTKYLKTALLLLGGALAAQASAQTLTFASWFAGEELENSATPKLNAEFEAANPGVKIQYEIIPQNAWQPTMNTRLSGGNAPDIFMGHAKEELRGWVSAGYIADISAEPWVSRLTASAKAGGSIDGKVC